MHLRSLLTAVAAGTLLPLAAATPASAALPAPVITSHQVGDTVSGTTKLTATSASTWVSFEVFASAETEWTNIRDVVPVVDGVASWDWPTYGFADGVRVRARACTASNSCPWDAESVEVSLQVDNDVDTFEAPTEPTWVNPDVTPVVVKASDADSVGTFRVRFNDHHYPLTLGEPLSLTFPNRIVGEGTLVLERCSPYYAGICAPASAPSATVSFRRAASSAYFTPTNYEYTFSPNGDGRKDALQGSIWLETGTDHTATWSIEKFDGTVLVSPVPVTPGDRGETAVSINPVAQGVKLPSGSYRVRVDSKVTDHGEEFTASTLTDVIVDVTPTTVRSIVTNASIFYPKTDAAGHTYRDYMSYKAYLSNAGYYTDLATVEVINGGGTVVRKLMGNSRFGQSPLAFSWNGRNSRGYVVPEGYYRVRIVLLDAMGNKSTFLGGRILLSHKRWVMKTYTKTVTAQGSLVHSKWTGACSTLRKPGTRGGYGSIGYYSNTKCTRDWDASVADGLHRVRLPLSVIKNGTLSLSYYGGAVKPYSRLGMALYNRDGRLFDEVAFFNGSWGWHPVKSGSSTRITDDGYVYWETWTGDGMRYDVSKYLVKTRYAAFV